MPNKKSKSAKKPSATNAKKKSKASAGSEAYHDFGLKSAALLAVKLTSDGEIQVFGGTCPVSPKPDASGNTSEFYSATHYLSKGGDVKFRMTLDSASDKVGILGVEVLGWPKAYDVNRAVMLGHFDPFGDEIAYPAYGGTNRPADKPANRSFDVAFHYDPDGKTTVTLTDVESGGMSEDTIDITKLYDEATGKPGGVIVSVRVPDAHYADGCATLTFDKKNMDDGSPLVFHGETRSGDVFNRTEFTLSKSTDMP